jgi:L-ascorbate metabolism protein UlaG (beta-lactamase superfamily)/phosphohistidine swiveling domain-containing protein
MKLKKLLTADQRLPLFMTLIVEGLTVEQRYITGCFLDSALVVGKKGVMNLYSDEESIENYKERVKKRIIVDKDFIFNTAKSMENDYNDLISFSKEIKETNLTNKSDFELKEMFQEFCLKFKKAMATHSFPFFADKVLSTMLINKINELNSFNENEAREYAAVLAMPIIQSDYKNEYLHFLQIIKEIKKDLQLVKVFSKEINMIKDELLRICPQIDFLLDEHIEKYSYIMVQHAYNPPNKDYYIKQIKNEVGNEVTDKIEEVENSLQEIKKKKEEVINKINVNEEIINLIKYLEKISEVNDFRKLGHSQALYLSHSLFKEIGKRVNLNHIEVKHLTPEEITLALDGGTFAFELVKERMENYLISVNKLFLFGKEAEKYVDKLLPTKNEDIRELKGQIASRGKVTGKVKLIIKECDIGEIKKGNILVTSMTNPEMILGMEKAAAIVTDEGGLLCHAAIVSREIGKPCIVGTEKASLVFKNGDLVEVDAEKGIVKKIDKHLEEKKMKIKWLGHAGFKIDDLLVDPWIGEIPAWHIKPNYEFSKEDKECSVIAVTHDHPDHQQGSAEIAKQSGATVVGMFECVLPAMKEGAKVELMNCGGPVEVNGWKVALTPAFHTGSAAGMILKKDGKTIYHAGDTCLFSDMKLIKELYQPEIALLPIGGRFTMDEYQAAKAVEFLGVKKVIPMHYNTFPLIEADPEKFKELVADNAEVIVLNPGDEVEL